MDYDPNQISYEQLLRMFWQSHAPGSRSWSRQYMNAVFYHNEKQRKAAEASKTALSEKSGKKVHTLIVPLRSFTMAEDYHQKYMLKGRKELTKAMRRYYSEEKAFVDSTAVARLNGYAGGHGKADDLVRDIDRLGLTPQEKEMLKNIVNGSSKLIIY